jgi:general secretion pathway protein G
MKRGFTMIELVFVIVILGILASIAIPRLAASRDDARAVSLKQDIGTLVQAIPAWYQGQREVSIENAMSLDTSLWVRSSTNLQYIYNDGSGGRITATLCSAAVGTQAQAIEDGTVTCNIIDGGTGTAVPDNATAFTTGNGSEPWLTVGLTAGNTGVVRMLMNDMNVTNQTVPMAGRRVVWN